MTEPGLPTGHGTAPCEHAGTTVGHAFGALEPDEEDRITAHLAHCDRCRAVLDDALAVTVALGRAVPQLDPPEALRERVLAAALAEPGPVPRRDHDLLRPVSPPPPAPSSPPLPSPPSRDALEPGSPGRGGAPFEGHPRPTRWRTALLAVVAAVVVGVGLLGVRAVLPSAPDAGTPSVTQAERAQQIVDDARSREPGTRVAMLRSSAGEPMAVVLDEPTGARVVPVAMTAPAAGRRDILWAAGPGAPVPVATVDPTSGTTVPLPGKVAPSATRAFAVSSEPVGPVPATPSMVMAVGVLV